MNKYMIKFHEVNSFRLRKFIAQKRTFWFEPGTGYTKVHDRCPKWVQYAEMSALIY
jgi:hypothetical protein